MSDYSPNQFSQGNFPTRRTATVTWKCFSSVQLLSRVLLFVTPWIAARQASLSITNSQSSLRLMSIESVMPSSHLILCRPLLLLPPIPPRPRDHQMECPNIGGSHLHFYPNLTFHRPRHGAQMYAVLKDTSLWRKGVNCSGSFGSRCAISTEAEAPPEHPTLLLN